MSTPPPATRVKRHAALITALLVVLTRTPHIDDAMLSKDEYVAVRGGETYDLTCRACRDGYHSATGSHRETDCIKDTTTTTTTSATESSTATTTTGTATTTTTTTTASSTTTTASTTTTTTPTYVGYDGSNGRSGNGSTTVAIFIGVVALLVVGFAVNATLSKSSDTGDIHPTSYSFENPMYQNNEESASSDSDDGESPGGFGAAAGYIDVSGSGASGSGAFYEDVPGFASTTATTSYMDVTGKPYGGAGGGDEDTHGNGAYSDMGAASAGYHGTIANGTYSDLGAASDGYHGTITNGTYSDISMGAADGYADVPGTTKTSGYVEVESFGGGFESGSASSESEEEV